MAFVFAFGLQANAQAIDSTSIEKGANMTPTLIHGPQGQLNTYRIGAGNAGLPVIFIHADPGRATQWKMVMKPLSKKHDVAAFDSRGSGDSQAPANGDYSYEGRASDIGAVADAYQMKRFVLVAHSAGAAVALQYAAMNGDRVAGLMMVDPATDPRAMPAKARASFIKDMTGPDSAQAFATYVESIAGENPKVRTQVIADAKKLNAEGRAGVAKATANWNPEITLKAYKGPMFILSTPATNKAGALYSLVPTIAHEVVPTKGHWIQMDHPDLVQKAIERFLVDVAGKTTALNLIEVPIREVEKAKSFYHGIVTRKLQETKQFYTKNLGFSVKFENEWFVLLDLEGRELAFMLPNLEFQNQIFRGEYAGKGLWLTVEVANVETELKRIQNLGIPVVVKLRKEEWGETHFSVVDPNGIGIDFVKYKATDARNRE